MLVLLQMLLPHHVLLQLELELLLVLLQPQVLVSCLLWLLRGLRLKTLWPRGRRRRLFFVKLLLLRLLLSSWRRSWLRWRCQLLLLLLLLLLLPLLLLLGVPLFGSLGLTSRCRAVARARCHRIRP